MRQVLLTVAMLLSLGAGAQDTLTTYYDKGWHVTDQEHARYYRKWVQQDGRLFVNQYSSADDHLELSGAYSVADTTREGYFVTYYENGVKQSEGVYTQNIQTGNWTTWDVKGRISSKESYLTDMGDIVKVIREDEFIRNKYKHQKKSPGWYEGVRHGLCIWYHENGRESAKEVYMNGKIKDARFWDEEGKPDTIAVTDVYDNTQTPFTDINLNEFVAKNIKYPKKARKSGSQGQVFVQMFITKEGSLTDIKVMRSTGDLLLDEEAVRVITMLNGLTKPMISHNRVKGTYYTLPIRFRLQ